MVNLSPSHPDFIDVVKRLLYTEYRLSYFKNDVRRDKIRGVVTTIEARAGTDLQRFRPCFAKYTPQTLEQAEKELANEFYSSIPPKPVVEVSRQMSFTEFPMEVKAIIFDLLFTSSVQHSGLTKKVLALASMTPAGQQDVMI